MFLSGSQLAGGNSVTDKAKDDFYTTNPETVKIFLQKFLPELNIQKIKTIWECACGTGNISEVIKDYFPFSQIISTDLRNRGYGEVKNFLASEYKNADMIITNPPFSKINDFIKQGLKLTKRYLIYFAKIQTLETKGRKVILENSPLKYVYVHSTRQATWKNNEPLDPQGKRWATTMCLAWFIWDKEYKGEPIIKFL